MGAFLAVLAGYVLGSVLFGVIVPRLMGVDIYSVGSGNPGTANVARAIGRKRALVVVVGDIGKGAVAAGLGIWVGDSVAAGYGAGLAAVAGHCYPLWRLGGGGKGVATAIGVLVVMSPWIGVGSLVFWALQLTVTKVASAGSLVLALVWVPGVAAFGDRGWALVWMVAISVLVLARHHENIKRLATGTERRVD